MGVHSMSAIMWLLTAIASEIAATSALKMSEGFHRLVPSIVVVVGYAIAFYGMAMSLKSIPLGIVYALWSGIGTVGVVLVGRYVFGERMDMLQTLGVVAVIGGVLLVNAGRGATAS